jgi:hypothetical protein
MSAKPKTTTQKLAHMMELATLGGESLYERIALAEEVLQDAEWIDTHYRNQGEAMDYLHDKYFADQSWLSMTRILTVYRKFPHLEEWRKYKFDLYAMWNECKPARDETERVDWKKRCAEMEKEIIELKLENAAVMKQLCELQQKAYGAMV